MPVVIRGAGSDSVLLYFKNMMDDNVAEDIFTIELRGNWYNRVGTGVLDVTLYPYLGGTFSTENGMIVNDGGVALTPIQFQATVLTGPLPQGEPGELIATLRYNRNTGWFTRS